MFLLEFASASGLSLSPKVDREKGLNGWSQSFVLGTSGVLMAQGGQRNAIWFSLSGEVCSGIHSVAWHAVADLLDTYDAEITRWDGAYDDFRGIHTVDWAQSLYLSGAFSTRGNKPKVRQNGDFLSDSDDDGRTLYVGSRKSGKVLRIYEKGKQLGNKQNPWVRWELELHNTDRSIPTDVLRNPAQYIAGAYDCMGWICGEVTQIPTYRNQLKASYDALTFHCNKSYGKHIAIMMDVEGSAEAVVRKLVRSGLPDRLGRTRPADVAREMRISEDGDD